MDDAPEISIAKDEALTAALARAASQNEPGRSDADLLRYLALYGADNLPPPYVPPTPERRKRMLEVWMRPKPPEIIELTDRMKNFLDPYEPRSRSDAD